MNKTTVLILLTSSLVVNAAASNAGTAASEFGASPSGAASTSAQPTTKPAAVEPLPVETAKNIILFIGDGVDDHQLSIARAYMFGLDGTFSFDTFPQRATALVRTVAEDDGSTPVYVADSANGGTSLASGVLTSRGRIGTTAKADVDVPNILELAQAAGLRTGVVTTASLTDATPACFLAHTSLRFCQGPNEMLGSDGLPGCPADQVARGGEGSIAEQIASSGADLLLGGGTRYLSQRGENGQIVVDEMTRLGYKLLSNAEELADFAPVAKGKVLGLFGNSTLPVEWMGENNQTSRDIVMENDAPKFPEPFRCEPNTRFGDRPTLEAMTRAAIEILSREAGDGGFFLMVESASIDKQAHAENPCGQIGETAALDQSVAVAAEFATRRGDTLVMVTSDHGHAPQIIPHPSLFSAFAPEAPVPMYPPGKIALLEPAAGGVLAISYGTNARFLEEHTGTQIPVYAMGPGSRAVTGLMKQTDVFEVMKAALGNANRAASGVVVKP